MLSLDDPRWHSLEGGYRQPYDSRPALRRLAGDWRDQAAWDELWGELHHQGDVGEASYAAVTVLADLARRAASPTWTVYALSAAIETERHAQHNPPVPVWLETAYGEAWRQLADQALTDLRTTADPLLVQSALAVVALARGHTKLGALIAGLDASELDEYLEEHIGWSDHYRPNLQPPAA